MLYPSSVATLRFSHYLLIKGGIFVLDDDKYPRDPRFADPYNHVFAVEDSYGQLYAVVDPQRYELRPLQAINPPRRKLRNRRCYKSADALKTAYELSLFDDPVATGQRATIHEQQRCQDCSKTVCLEKDELRNVFLRNMHRLRVNRNIHDCLISQCREQSISP